MALWIGVSNTQALSFLVFQQARPTWDCESIRCLACAIFAAQRSLDGCRVWLAMRAEFLFNELQVEL